MPYCRASSRTGLVLAASSSRMAGVVRARLCKDTIMSGGSLCFPDELLNSAVHDAASGKPRITRSAYMIIRDATPTPVGDYNPDWAICFKEGSVRHIHFIAETKGTLSSMKLRTVEEKKI